jgi:hypothetical protein
VGLGLGVRFYLKAGTLLHPTPLLRAIEKLIFNDSPREKSAEKFESNRKNQVAHKMQT